MGIPSYYKKWIDTCPGLVRSSHPDHAIDWLLMDFNCLIYHCIQQSTMPVYEPDQEEEWEDELLQHVEDYTKHILQQVRPQKGVYLAVDGVVPLAKMRQQRLRRFKSQWMAKKEGKIKWDTNAITPGTVFMEKLFRCLTRIKERSTLPSFLIHSSDEPGEGEHKIMNQWRKDPSSYSGPLAIYGLDGDLIVLSLLSRVRLAHTQPVWLFREKIEQGKGVMDPVTGEECMDWFAIHELDRWIGQKWPENHASYLLSYCFIMSILGNDFLPRSLHLTLRDEGHEEMVQILTATLQTHGSMIDESLQIQFPVLSAFFKNLSAQEDQRMIRYLLRRKRMIQLYANTETDLGESNWPLTQFEEGCMLQDRQLHPQWMDRYLGFFSNHSKKKEICDAYIDGIQWIWAYYLGKEVDCDWYYPYSLPPLWTWLAECSTFPEWNSTPSIGLHSIRTQEQLCMVLPLSSWHLLRDPILRRFAQEMPYYFPESFEFDAMGKRFFWECEPILPIPSVKEIHSMVTSFADNLREIHNKKPLPL